MGFTAADKGKGIADGDSSPRKKRRKNDDGGVYILCDDNDEEHDEEMEEAPPDHAESSAQEEVFEGVPEDVCFWKVKCKSELSDGNAVRAVHSCPLKHTIKSVIAFDHSKGYIYVEADNEDDVKEVTKAVRKKGRSSISVFAARQMFEVLRALDRTTIRREDWVEYKGDLAKVMEVNPVKKKALIKRVPRVDIDELKNGLKKSVKSRMNAPPKLITLKELTDMNINVKRRRDQGHELYIVGSLTFCNGYLVNTVSLAVLMKASPSSDEILSFKIAGAPAAEVPLATQLVKGDKVEVVGGNHAGKLGVFERLERTAVYVQLDGKECSMHESYVRRHYQAGERLCVASGEHEGATGIATYVDEDHVNLLTDVGETIRVSMDCISGSSYVPPALNKIGNYVLHDMVAVTDQQTFGMILKLDKTAIQILKGVPDKVELMTAKGMELSKILDSKVAQDCASNAIRLKEVVRVQSGCFKGKEGPVTHINGGVLFVHDNKYLECSGFFCVLASSCFRLGGINKPSDMPAFNTGGGFQKKKNHRLLGKKVRITRGVYKSYRGRVSHVFQTSAHVFLEANLKTVSVPIKDLKDLEPDDGGEGAPQAGYTNPSAAADISAGWDDNGATNAAAGWDNNGATNAAAGWDNNGMGAANAAAGWDENAGNAEAGWGDTPAAAGNVDKPEHANAGAGGFGDEPKSADADNFAW